MTMTAKFALGAALGLSMISQAQQNPQPQPQAPPKIENPCAPRTESATERQVKAKVGRIVGNWLNKGNQKIQKDTKGNAPVVAPDDLPKQAHTPCEAPAAVTPPPIAK